MPSAKALTLFFVTISAAVFAACGGDEESAVGDASSSNGGQDGAARDGGSASGGRGGVAPPSSTSLHVRVFDTKTGKNVPSKVFLFVGETVLLYANYGDPPFCTGTGESMIDVAPGAVATQNGIILHNGEATIPLPFAGSEWPVKPNRCVKNRPPVRFGAPARLRVVATRGLEYEHAEAVVDVAPGLGVIDVPLGLSRAVDTSGYVAADLHIHSALWRDGALVGGSGDGAVSPVNRVKTELAAGIEVMVSADHDYLTDLGQPLRELFPDPAAPPPAATVVGNEASGGFGHFNVMPLAYEPTKPRNGALDGSQVNMMGPRALFEALHALPTKPLVQVNHPRLGWAAYFDTDNVCGGTGGWLNRNAPPTCSTDFDAIEIMSGFLACTTKIRQQLEDWYALARFGVVVTGVGSSDTHFDSGILAGFPRSFVRTGEDDPTRFDEGEFIAALRRRAAIATTGPFVTLTVNDRFHEGDLVPNAGNAVKASLRVQHPSWMRPDTVRLLVDGVPVKSWTIDAQAAATGTFAVTDEPLALTKDAFVNVEVEGQQMLPDWLVGNYLSLNKFPSGAWYCPNADNTGGMRPFAVTNFVLVDVDGDGRWKGPQQPAAALPLVEDKWIAPAEGADDCDPRRHWARETERIKRKKPPE